MNSDIGIIRSMIAEFDLSEEQWQALERAITILKSQPCEDCISRKAVLDAVDTYDKFGYTETGCFIINPKGDYVPYIHYDDVIKCVKSMSSVIPQQTSWIPCSERLPERDTNVLAYHKNVSFEYVYVSWIDDYTGKWAGFIGNLPDDVLAWMPLPEPYKEGEE